MDPVTAPSSPRHAQANPRASGTRIPDETMPLALALTAQARSSATAGTNITNPGSPSSAGNGPSGSALPSWLHQFMLGGSRSSGQLPIFHPSPREPALRRRSFAAAAAAAPGPSSQRHSSAAAESTGTSISEIPPGDIGTPPPSLSSASSSPSRGTATRTPSAAAAGANAARDATGSDEQVGATATRTGSPAVQPAPAPVATDREDAMKILAINVAANGALLAPVLMNIKDISSWETGWIWLYGIVLLVAFYATIISIFTAWSRNNWWAITFSSICVRLGLLAATSLFVVDATCHLPLGCVAGVPIAAVSVLFLVVIWWIC